MSHFQIQDTFNKELIADLNTENRSREVKGAHFSYVNPRVPSMPKLIHFSDEMMRTLGIDEKGWGEELLDFLSGKKIYPNTKPYAMCYGGHQFGHWAGQLGDGRAINLFETVADGKRWALQLKGAGHTPYSRKADGLAVLRSSVREYLCSEAMHHLGVPTTRALSLISTGDEVLRDMLYDGRPSYEKGAIVCRVSPSFIRFGNFEILAARNDIQNLRLLTDYTINYFYPHIKRLDKDGYLQFFNEISERTLELIIHWQRVGFVHGVMNTDNMSILGLTIDYGPYGWLEGYELGWTPNITDAEGRRYRYENQPDVALWNLLQLANALYPLIEDIPALESILTQFHSRWKQRYFSMMADKLGIIEVSQDVEKLILDLEKNLEMIETDMTIFFRNLSQVDALTSSVKVLNLLEEAIYNKGDFIKEVQDYWLEWFDVYRSILNREQALNPERVNKMNQTNPKYVLRNYMAQLAIDSADKGDYSVVDELYNVLKKPYDEQLEHERWFSKRPEWARTKVGCSMLSCSS